MLQYFLYFVVFYFFILIVDGDAIVVLKAIEKKGGKYAHLILLNNVKFFSIKVILRFRRYQHPHVSSDAVLKYPLFADK